jgi:hypothetical protein
VNRFVFGVVAIAAPASVVLGALIAGCVPSTSPTTFTEQNLNSAIVQATNAALVQRDAASATEQTRQRINDQNARATDTAASATQQAANATKQSNDATKDALNLQQAQIIATATTRAILNQSGIDSDKATRTAAESRAA